MMWSTPPAEPPAKVTLATSALQRVGEILRVLIGEFAGTTMTRSLVGEPRDRRHLVEVDRRLVGQDRADHDEAVHHQLVAVALGAVDELRDADGAAGAGMLVTCTLFAAPD